MLKLRMLLLTLLFGAALVGYWEGQKRGLVRQAEQWIIGFLVANARDTMEKNVPAASDDVVLVKFDEKDREEFGGWPPVALDWMMVMKRLAAYEPEVVAVVQPLRWDGPAGEFVKPLQEALLPFPAVVLGFELATEAGEMSAEVKEFAQREMPMLPGTLASELTVPFARVVQVPDRTLRLAAQTGFSKLDGFPQGEDKALFVAGNGTALVPSLAAQVVTLYRRAPYSTMQMSFGAGARLSLADDYVVPLTTRGELRLGEGPTVPVLEGLDLMLPDLQDEASTRIANLLGKGKAIILTLDEKAGMEQARAVARGLAMPSLTRLEQTVEWGAAVLAALFSYVVILHRGRFGSLMMVVLAVVLTMGVNMALFQSKLIWWSPVMAFLLLAVAGVFCFLWPFRAAVVDEAATEKDVQSS